jgi:hypothetical protein
LNRGEAGADRWAPATVLGGAGSHGSNRFQIRKVQKHSNFDRSQFDLPELQKFGITYGFEDLERMDNFLHRNFFTFGKDLE